MDEQKKVKELFMRMTGERGDTLRPSTEAALQAMIERSQKEINEAQQQIHDLAYALFNPDNGVKIAIKR